MLDRSQGNTVFLQISASNSLCTLVEMSPNYEIKPVGRSYNGFEWEQYAGDFSSLTFTCVSNECSVDLPEPEAGKEYYLTSFAHSLNPNDVAARFLEKTTFGPTKADIALFQSFVSSADYLEEQFSKDMTSHRAYWRSKVGDWRALTNTATTLYANPCDTGARYRKYAIIRDDYRRYMQIETVGAMVAVSVGGNYNGDYFVRTVVANVTAGGARSGWSDPGFIIPDGT
jgi:hypothetical protein